MRFLCTVCPEEILPRPDDEFNSLPSRLFPDPLRHGSGFGAWVLDASASTWFRTVNEFLIGRHKPARLFSTMIRVNVDQAGGIFSQWIALVEKGEEIVVFDHERPVARILGCEQQMSLRPKVGTITSAPVCYAEGCFDAMSEAELKDWGV